MLGNGVDMYDLIPYLKKDDIHVVEMPEHIWIGVIEQTSPSTPVPRHKTKCYTKCPVYLFKGRRIFSMIRDFETGEMDFYFIPDEELCFIERG